jgi:hypothetical protein
LQNKYTYKSAPKAGAYFKMPSTVKDHLNQISRYQREDDALIKYFGDWIKPEYIIPKSMLYKFKLQAFLKYPIHTLAIFGLNFYAKNIMKTNKSNSGANWTVIKSTKEVINNG